LAIFIISDYGSSSILYKQVNARHTRLLQIFLTKKF